MIVLIALVAAAAVAWVGWSWWSGDGTLRPGSGECILPADVHLTASAFGPAATLLLFTSQQEQRGPAVRLALDRVSTHPIGVAVAEVDLTRYGDLAGRYGITRTPTVLALDADGRLRARVKGAGDDTTLRRALDAALGRASTPR